MLHRSRFQTSAWLRGALRHSVRSLYVVLLLLSLPTLSLLTWVLPAQAQQPQPQSSPQTLNFVGGVAQVQGVATLNQNQVYLFFGTQGQTVQIQLSSQPTAANFEVRGANNTVYKSLGDLNTNWSTTIPESQNYRITVVASTPVIFNLIVTINGGSSAPQRITFLPGQTTSTVSGSAGPGQNPQYIFTASAGQTLRITLNSTSNLANFSVAGVSDGIIYKQLSDPTRDWTTTVPSNQDYVITVSSPSLVTFTLTVTLSGAQPAERINFAPGQSVIVLNGNLQPNIPKVYVFSAAAGQFVRVVLASQPPGSANFSLVGAQNSAVYKDQNDPAREWQFTAPVSQDYLLTVFSPQFSNYALELTVATPLPPITPATLTPTPLPTIPAGCVGDVIKNGGFDTNQYWVFGDTAVQPAYTSLTFRTPPRSVRLGIDPALGTSVQNLESFSSIRQPFQLPASANAAQLRWSHLDRTEETPTDSPGSGQDKQEVVLLNPKDLSTVAVLYSQRQNTGTWVDSLVDLTPYIGRSLVLYFNVFNDGNGQRTWQFVDDVIVAVCYPAVAPTAAAAVLPPAPVVASAPLAAAAAQGLPTSNPNLVVPTVNPTLLAGVTPSAPQAPNASAAAQAQVTPNLVATLAAMQTAAASVPAAAPAGASGAMSAAASASTPIPTNAIAGEPTVFVMTTAQATAQAQLTTQAQLGAQIQAQLTQQAQLTMQPQPLPQQNVVPGAVLGLTTTPTPIIRVAAPAVFDRPVGRDLTWLAAMCGIPALIVLLAVLIWRYASRD